MTQYILPYANKNHIILKSPKPKKELLLPKFFLMLLPEGDRMWSEIYIIEFLGRLLIQCVVEVYTKTFKNFLQDLTFCCFLFETLNWKQQCWFKVISTKYQVPFTFNCTFWTIILIRYISCDTDNFQSIRMWWFHRIFPLLII